VRDLSDELPSNTILDCIWDSKLRIEVTLNRIPKHSNRFQLGKENFLSEDKSKTN
jgi:hypothetical protein